MVLLPSCFIFAGLGGPGNVLEARWAEGTGVGSWNLICVFFILAPSDPVCGGTFGTCVLWRGVMKSASSGKLQRQSDTNWN